MLQGFPRLAQKGEDKQARKEGRDTDKGEFCLHADPTHTAASPHHGNPIKRKQIQRGVTCSLAPLQPPHRLAVLPLVTPVHRPSSSPPQGCPDQSRWVGSPDNQTELGPSALTGPCGLGALTLSLALIFLLPIFSKVSPRERCLLFWAPPIH